MKAVNHIKEEIKIRKMLIKVLEKEVDGTAYNRNDDEVHRKKEKLLNEIVALEDQIRSQNDSNLIK